MRFIRLLGLASALCLPGCPSVPDSKADAGREDAGALDAGPGDAGVLDAGSNGCTGDEQCATNEACDTTSGECDCAVGFHRCGGECVPDDAVETCGQRCEPCEAMKNAVAACSMGTCTYACAPNARSCGGSCATCPTTGVTETACAGSTCEAVACVSGRRACDGECAKCPTTGVTATDCRADACVATTCEPGFLLCNGACTTCQLGQKFCCIETVDNTPGAGTDLAMDVAPDGSVALAWYAYTAQDLVVATLGASASAWTVERVATQGDVGAGASIAIGPDGTLHVTYYDLIALRLRYARKAPGGSWTFEVVDPFSMWLAGESSLKLDAQGEPRVAYWANNSLRYAERTSTGWTVVGVDPAAGEHPDLVLDGDGNPHITYSVSGNQMGATIELLKYATRSNGTWTQENLYSTHAIAASTESSVAVDAQGTVHVLYFSANWLQLRHMQKPAGGTWTTAIPVSGISPLDGKGMSLKVAPDGQLHATWKLFMSKEVVYATWLGGNWSHETISVAPAPEAWTVLGFDAEGRPHVAWWMKSPSDAVRFAR